MKDFPEQCSTCKHYDNFEGICHFKNEIKKEDWYVDYCSHCKHWKLATELTKEKDNVQPNSKAPCVDTCDVQ